MYYKNPFLFKALAQIWSVGNLSNGPHDFPSEAICVPEVMKVPNHTVASLLVL